MSSSKWLIVALIASLAGNLALAGFVVGRLSASGSAPAALDPSLGLFRILRELPESRQEALRPALREHFRSVRPNIRQMRDAQSRINDALKRDPFDSSALADALSAFRTALLDSQQASHQALVRVAADMTPEERRLLREAMTRPVPGLGFHRDGAAHDRRHHQPDHRRPDE